MEEQLGLSYASIEKGAKHRLLQNFITEFLPMSNYRGTYRHNEFSNVYSSLEKIFSRKVHIKIEPEELAACLDAAGYHCYIRVRGKRLIKTELKQLKVCITPEDDFYGYGDEYLLFVNISSKDVGYLKRAIKSIALQRDPSEIIRLRFLKRKIKSFFKTHLS